jgi:hypothetical protein
MKRLRFACGVALTLGVLGCETAKQVGREVVYDINPVGTTDVAVVDVARHEPYLVAQLAGSLEDMKMIVPMTDECVAMVEPGARMKYAKHGVFGRFHQDGAQCDPIGVASLEAWRDRQPRNWTMEPVPRATARYEPLGEDAEFIFVRGRFPLASRVYIPAGYDLVALLPKDPACKAVAEKSEASLEFRHAGRQPFVMLAGGQQCNVLGFAMPYSVASKP